LNDLNATMAAAQAYVRMKKVAAKQIGFHSVDVTLPATASEAEIVAAVQVIVVFRVQV